MLGPSCTLLKFSFWIESAAALEAAESQTRPGEQTLGAKTWIPLLSIRKFPSL